MIYAFKTLDFRSSFLVHILAEDGTLINVHEFRSYKKAPELLQKWFGNDLEFVKDPWNHPGVQKAKDNYRMKYEMELGV